MRTQQYATIFKVSKAAREHMLAWETGIENNTVYNSTSFYSNLFDKMFIKVALMMKCCVQEITNAEEDVLDGIFSYK